MGQGNYDHPSYLTRQQLQFGRTTAGASGTSIRTTFPSAMRIRQVTAGVVTAGTTASAAAGIIIQSGTTALGTITLSTNVAGVFGTSGDLNTTIAANGTLAFVNGADATFVANVSAEMYLDPAATWTGSNN